MNKNITLMSSCLLLISTQVFADRPAMEDSPPPPAAEAAAPTVIQEPVETAPVSAVDMSMQHEADSASTSVSEQITGDALELQPGETLTVKALDFPRRGMTMEKVQNELGVPNEISDTIGEPPITSWTYADRVVYFEHSNVIHAVANH